MNITDRLGICEGIDALELDLSHARERDPAAVQPIQAQIARLERLLGNPERKKPRQRD